MCAAPGSKTAQLIEYLHSDESNPIPSKYIHIFSIIHLYFILRWFCYC